MRPMGPKQSLESFAAGKLGLAFLQEVVHQDDEQGPDFQPPMDGEISHFFSRNPKKMLTHGLIWPA